MSYLKSVRETMQNEYKGKKSDDYNYRAIYKQKLIDFRKQEESVAKLERPSNLARAREIGYKAKNGVFIVRAAVRKGSGAHSRPNRARRPKRMGVNKLTRKMSIQGIAEQRAARKFKNAEVLSSYWAAEDGKHEFYEIIMVDPNAPEIKADKDLNWLSESQHTRKAFRGLTPAQKKSRGLNRRGKGAERVRPSRRAHKRKSK